MAEKQERVGSGYRWLVLIGVAVGFAIVPLLYTDTWSGALKYWALNASFMAWAAIRSPLAPPEKIGRPLAVGIWVLGFALTLLTGALRQFAGSFEVGALLFVMLLALGEIFRPIKNR